MQKSVCDWLDIIEKKYPSKIAYFDEKNAITFSVLKRKAIALASVLINYRQSPIAVYMKKGITELEAFWGISYSGNFYTPIDDSIPIERIKNIFDTLHPKAVVIDSDFKEIAEKEFGQIDIIVFDEIINDLTNDFKTVMERRNQIIDTDLLYVLYTSGSTGIPKGVCVTHRNLISYIDNVQDVFGFTEKNIFGNQAPFYFDHSLLDIYMPARTGCSCGIVPRVLFSQPVRLLEYIVKNKIDTLFWVPSALTIVSRFNAFKNISIKGCVKYVISGGDVLPVKEINKWREALPEAIFANMYGPTETTGDITYYIINRYFSEDETIPLGRVFGNNRIVVLKDNGEEVVNGEIGELCVYGSQVSSGYYNNKKMTEAAFLPYVLNNSFERVVYRTGDLVKINEKGEILFVSRKDNQVKHMGHRIELGEIEVAASAMNGASQCVSLYDKDKDRIILFMDVQVEVNDVLEFLKGKIPDYMIPHKIIYISEYPLNRNGKIDRKKLFEFYKKEK